MQASWRYTCFTREGCLAASYLYVGIYIVYEVMGALHIGAQVGWLQWL